MSKPQATQGTYDTLRGIALEALRKYVESLHAEIAQPDLKALIEEQKDFETAAFVRGYYMGLREGMEAEGSASCQPVEHLLSVVFGEGIPDFENANDEQGSSKEAA